MNIKYWEELHKKQEIKHKKIANELDDFLFDLEIIHEIGNKTYEEFAKDWFAPLLDNFPKTFTIYSNGTYKGHRMSLIKYYCDVFNEKKDK